MTNGKSSRRIGLARALSKLGYCSRSQAATIIREGRVQLNGATHRNPQTPVCLERDRIVVDGESCQPQQKIYLVLNKPRGVITTASDEKGRDTIYSVLNKTEFADLPWLAPVGRLDKASEGLLLLTNDSEWAARITDPESHLEKTYHVQITTLADELLISKLVQGVREESGEVLKAKSARQLRSGQKNCWLEVVLDEGRNRHIRRMMAALGVETLRLVRVAIGTLQLGNLAKGRIRPLTAAEKLALDCMPSRVAAKPSRGVLGRPK